MTDYDLDCDIAEKDGQIISVEARRLQDEERADADFLMQEANLAALQESWGARS